MLPHFPSQISLIVPVDVKHHVYIMLPVRVTVGDTAGDSCRVRVTAGDSCRVRVTAGDTAGDS